MTKYWHKVLNTENCIIKIVVYNYMTLLIQGARCSFVVKAFTRGAMGRWIDPSWWTHLGYFSVQPVSHDWCNKGRGVWYPVCGMVHIK